MFLKFVGRYEAFIAKQAFMRKCSCVVSDHMLSQTRLLIEGFRTIGTTKRLLIGVRSHVILQRLVTRKLLAAMRAHKVLTGVMHCGDVSGQIALGVEYLLAKLARKLAGAVYRLDVLVEVDKYK